MITRSLVVLHGHLPWTHEPEHASFLEEDWFFEALLETYLPTIDLLDRLEQDGIPARFTIGLTPPLLEMLRQPSLLEKAERYLSRRLELAQEEVARTALVPNAPTLPAAKHYLERFQMAYASLMNAERDVIEAFAHHARTGRLELMASSATHAILPALATPEGLRAQIQLGTSLFEEVFGFAPRGFWMPECAYRPGQESAMRDAGLEWTIVETHGVTAADPRPEHGVLRPIRWRGGGPAAFGRDPISSRQVWSKEVGYPGDPDYRERYRDLGFDGPYDYVQRWLHGDGVRRDLGIKYHRVTGDVSLDQKAFWNPDHARARTREHARHFLEERARLVDGARVGPVCTSPYDFELFGHWWYEGPWFLEELARTAAGNDLGVVLATPGEILDSEAHVDEGWTGLCTWGENGYLDVWVSPKTSWIVRHQQELERRLVGHAANHAEPNARERRLLDQMARELCLLQSSDWAFILTHETAEHFAKLRVHDHASRFLMLEKLLLDEEAELPEDTLRTIEKKDCLFPGIDFRLWAGGPAARPGESLGTSS